MSELNGLPSNPQAESGLLCSMLIDPTIIPEVMSQLSENDFYIPTNRQIFSSMRTLFLAGKDVDLVTVIHVLREKGQFVEGQTDSALIEIAQEVPSSAHFKSYVEIVQMKSSLREIVIAGKKIVEEGSNGITDFEDFRSKVLEEFYRAASKRTKTRSVSSSEIEATVAPVVEKNPVTTGYHDLDRRLSGFHAGDLVILAAATSMGKSAFAQALTLGAAKKQHPTLYFSMEMTPRSIFERMISMKSRVAYQKIRDKKLSEEETNACAEAKAWIANLPIEIRVPTNATVAKIRAEIKMALLRSHIEFVVIDYLTLIRGSKKFYKSKYEEVTDLSNSMKAIAVEFDIPVLALAQLNRAPAHRQEKRPLMSDIRDSGAVEQDADSILLLYRENYYTSEDSSLSGPAELSIAKNRAGSTGTVPLYFDAETVTFHPGSRLENPV